MGIKGAVFEERKDGVSHRGAPIAARRELDRLSVTGAWAGVLWPVMFRVWARFTELASQIRINRIRIVGEANRAGRAKRTPEAGLEVKTVDYGP